MILLIIVAVLFYKRSKGSTGRKVLWAFIGIASFYLMQLIGVFLLGLVNVELLYESGIVFIVGLLSGIVGIAVTYRLMDRMGPEKTPRKENPDLIDDTL